MGTINSIQKGPWSDGNKGVLHIRQNSVTESLPPDAILCDTQNTMA